MRKRNLPWRKTKDPYPIWLSEIILQQTRVEQGLPYWNAFIEEFPNVHHLANAPEEKVLRLWQGLGYYSRARNLHAAAKDISRNLQGVFPKTYSEILKLKGVGPYTAAAIASICFDEPTPVVDGNVFRFASRYFGIQSDITASKARKEFETVLSQYIAIDSPGQFNQAMMEFGATVCSPKPQCSNCSFATDCFAFINEVQAQLPVKSKKTKVRERYLNYIVLENDEGIFLKERVSKDVWKGLYDFALVEGNLTEDDVLNAVKKDLQIDHFVVKAISEPYVHLLSHQKIIARFYDLELSQNSSANGIQNSSLHPYSKKEILNLPKPKLIVNYLEQRGLKS